MSLLHAHKTLTTHREYQLSQCLRQVRFGVTQTRNDSWRRVNCYLPDSHQVPTAFENTTSIVYPWMRGDGENIPKACSSALRLDGSDLRSVKMVDS